MDGYSESLINIYKEPFRMAITVAMIISGWGGEQELITD